MIAKLAEIVTVFYLKNFVIDPDEADMYQYGNEIMISSLLDLLIVIGVGLVFGKLINSVLFFLFFLLLRSFTGGYHADTYFKCKIIFLINICLSVYLSGYEYKFYSLYLLIVLIVFSFLVITKMSPIENENKPLSKEEIRINSIRSKIVSSVLVVLIFAMYFFNKSISLSLLLSFFSVAVGVIIGYVKKGGSLYEDN